MTGPLTGTRVPLIGRHHVTTRSPLTGILGEANAGGHWGSMLKKAGYDGLIIIGEAKLPVYIWICDRSIEIRDASHLWGLDTYEVDKKLIKKTDSKMVAATIGQAGENLTLISSIMHDGRHARAAARCGVGAVMGSKKLKAIAGIKPRHLKKWLNTVVGWSFDLDTFMKTGERIFNLKRQYNVELGVSKKDDILPHRILTSKRRGGVATGNLPPLNLMLSEHYDYRKWDEFGKPTIYKLKELGLMEEINRRRLT